MLIGVSQDGVFVALQALGGTLAALGLFGFALSDPFLVALFVVHGFLHACAALREKRATGGVSSGRDEVLRWTGNGAGVTWSRRWTKKQGLPRWSIWLLR